MDIEIGGKSGDWVRIGNSQHYFYSLKFIICYFNKSLFCMNQEILMASQDVYFSRSRNTIGLFAFKINWCFEKEVDIVKVRLYSPVNLSFIVSLYSLS